MVVTALYPVTSKDRYPQRPRKVRGDFSFSEYLNEAVAANSNIEDTGISGLLPQMVLPDVIDLSIFAQLLLTNIPDGPGFLLTETQMEALAHIIAQRRGDALTPENFTTLMDDLRRVRLAPEQLAAQDMLRFFDLTVLLIEAAEGYNPGIDFNRALSRLPIPMKPDERAIINRYLLYVIGLWQGILPGHQGATQEAFELV